ncbi:cyclic nucleotide-binding domain-containing protein [Candidatus Riflebacteria bacterium]
MENSGTKEIRIRDIPIFSGLADPDLEKIQGITYEHIFNPGEYLFKQGDIGDAFYIIKAGNIDILKIDAASGEEKVIVSLSPGEFFGEMALIEGAPRNASARAVTEATMLVVKKSDFEMLLRLNSFVALKIMSELSTRLHGEDSIAVQEKSEHEGALLTFFSPKGGCGKSLSIIHLAEAFVRQDKSCKVLLLDLALQFGDVGSLLNIPEEKCIKDLLGDDGENIDISKLDSVIYSHKYGFDVIPGPFKPEDSELIHSKHIKQILPSLRERYDFIMVDTHCLFEDLTINLLDLSDLVFIFFLPVFLHVKNLGTCLRVINDLEFDINKFHLMVSRYNLKDYGAEQVLAPERIEGLLKSTTQLDIKIKFRLSDDQDLINTCIENGDSIYKIAQKEGKLEKSKLIRDFKLLADCLMRGDKDTNFTDEIEEKGSWF